MPHDPSVYRQVALIHARCIDQGFLSNLGTRFLTLLYRVIDENEDSVLIVENSHGRVVGFVAGSCGTGSIYRGLLRHWLLLGIALAPIIIQPRNVIGILEVFRHSRNYSDNIDLPAYELLSIAVIPEARGSGLADKLYQELTRFFRIKKVPNFKIVVGESLVVAHKFYLRMGAVPVANTKVHSSTISTVYIQQVS